MELGADTVRYIICKTMGWDYHTFQRQPRSFVEGILSHLMAEWKKADDDHREYERKANRARQVRGR